MKRIVPTPSDAAIIRLASIADPEVRDYLAELERPGLLPLSG